MSSQSATPQQAVASPSLSSALSTPSGSANKRSTKKKRSRLVDRNSPDIRVKDTDAAAHSQSPTPGTQVAVTASDDDTTRLNEMLARERERQKEKKRRAARKKRDAAIKKKQLAQSKLKKTMLYRHWAKIEEKIHNPPPPKPKSFKEVVHEPGDVEMNAEFTHPATTSYHTMKHLTVDCSIINPIFLNYPVDLQTSRTTLVPDWKRALERKRPLPVHPSLRNPCMLGYSMHARSGWDPALFNPIFYGYRTATGDHLDAEGIQELINERESLFPRRPRFMWQLRNKFIPCFLCGKPEGEVRNCVRCGRRQGGPAEAVEKFNFVEAREVAAANAATTSATHDKEQLAIQKVMARSNYVDVIIKPMPMGKVITLKMDNRSTMQYLYFLYRSNVGGELAIHHSVNLFLPTYKGTFYLDWKIIPETPTSLGSDAGYYTLADYNVTQAGVTVCLVESPTYQKRQSENLFNLYLTRNLVHAGGLSYNKEIQYFHDNLPTPVPHPEDFIQGAMRTGIESMEKMSQENEQRRQVLKMVEDTLKAKEEHQRSVMNSERFQQKAKRLIHKAQGNLTAKAIKERMKARKREERERLYQKRLADQQENSSTLRLLEEASRTEYKDNDGEDSEDDGYRVQHSRQRDARFGQ